MKKNIYLWGFSGFAVTALLGTLSHYLYKWSGKNPILGAFCGINESTWEHMKLLYFPLLLFAVVQSRFFSDKRSFWCVKLLGILTGLILIPAIFYTYNGAVGKSPDWFNIAIFFIADACSFTAETRLFIKNTVACKNEWIAITAILTVGLMFVLFTFFTPAIPLFTPPEKQHSKIKALSALYYSLNLPRQDFLN